MAYQEDELKRRKEELETFNNIRVKLTELLKEYTLNSQHLHPDYIGKVNSASSALLNLMKCSDISMELRIEIDRLEAMLPKSA